MTSSQTTSSLKIDNVIELRVIPRPELDLEDISYFTHNGWVSFKTELHQDCYVLLRHNPPLEAFDFYKKSYDYDENYVYQD